jgi:hypothetical protein
MTTTMTRNDVLQAARVPGTRLATWWMLGLWIRLGFAGALAIPAGLAMLGDAETSMDAALALAVGGAALLALAVWRGRRALARLDAPDARSTGPGSQARGTTGVRVPTPSRRPA